MCIKSFEEDMERAEENIEILSMIIDKHAFITINMHHKSYPVPVDGDFKDCILNYLNEELRDNQERLSKMKEKLNAINTLIGD